MCQKTCATNHVSLRFLKMCPQGFTLVHDIWLKTCGHMLLNHVEKNMCRTDYEHVEKIMPTMWTRAYANMLLCMCKIAC